MQSYSKCQCKTTDVNPMSVCFAIALLAESSLNHLVHFHASCSLEVPLVILVFDASKCTKYKDHSLYLCSLAYMTIESDQKPDARLSSRLHCCNRDLLRHPTSFSLNKNTTITDKHVVITNLVNCSYGCIRTLKY